MHAHAEAEARDRRPVGESGGDGERREAERGRAARPRSSSRVHLRLVRARALAWRLDYSSHPRLIDTQARGCRPVAPKQRARDARISADSDVALARFAAHARALTCARSQSHTHSLFYGAAATRMPMRTSVSRPRDVLASRSSSNTTRPRWNNVSTVEPPN